MSIYLIIITVFGGFILGSFVNAYSWRVKKNEESRSKSAKYSIINGRSICPECERQLSALDLIPVFSWIYLRGECRYCKKPISPIYPIVELTTVVLFLFSLVYWPFGLSGSNLVLYVVWLLILTIFIALTIYDIKYLTLPNKMLYPLTALVIIYAISKLVIIKPGDDFLLNSALGFLVGGGIFYLIFQVSSGKWIGGGDVKLGAILGLLLGNGTEALIMIFIASVLGSLVSIPLLLSGKLKGNKLIPYGPFLIFSCFLLTLFYGSIKTWLNNQGIYL